MKLSIITVNLNNLEGLKRTYESVVCQTFTDYEWSVIDGGSTDGSREFIEQHQDKFAYWCSEPDKGIYNAMNKGIVRAKGEYLNFMNSGDCFADKETLAGVFEKERTADILYGYITVGGIKGGYHPYRTTNNNPRWYEICYAGTLHHQSTFIKRELFDKIGLYDDSYKIAADIKWFVIAISKHGASCEFIANTIAIFAPGGKSTHCSDNEKNKLHNDLFPYYFTQEELLTFYKVSIIQSYKPTRFLFKVLTTIAFHLRGFYKKCNRPKMKNG